MIENSSILIQQFDKFSNQSERSNILDEVSRLDMEFMKYAWTQAQWGDFDLSEDYILTCLFLNNTLIAFALYYSEDNEGEGHYCHLQKIVTHKDWRGQGLAMKLLTHDIEALSKMTNSETNIFLEVSESNKAAISLYEKVGFKKYHIAKKYYSDGSSAVKMSYKVLQL